MKIKNYRDVKWEDFHGKKVFVKEKDGRETKGRCKVYVEGYAIDDDRDMVINGKGILINDIEEIEIIDE